MSGGVPVSVSERTDFIKATALESGFDACGVTGVEPFVRHLRELSRRSERYPQSRELYGSLRNRINPSEQAPWAKSIVVGLLHYGKYEYPDALAGYFGRYYAVDTRLGFTTESRAFQDFQDRVRESGIRIECHSMPLREVATRSGIASIGKNNFVFSKEFGSWIALRSWYIDAELMPDPPSELPVCPRSCTACIDACPTGALKSPYNMDYGRCIAHLSYDVDTVLDPNLMKSMETWIYGCDACQTACPINMKLGAGDEPFPGLSEVVQQLDPRSILTHESGVSEEIQERFWYIPPNRLWLWKVNAVRALANAGDDDAADLIRTFALNDTDSRIRTVAEWALGELQLGEDDTVPLDEINGNSNV